MNSMPAWLVAALLAGQKGLVAIRMGTFTSTPAMRWHLHLTPILCLLDPPNFTGASLFGARNAARLSVDRNGVGDLLVVIEVLSF
jgi:hypothetical protein